MRRFKDNNDVKAALEQAKEKLAAEGKDPRTAGLKAIVETAFRIQDMKNRNGGEVPTVH